MIIQNNPYGTQGSSTKEKIILILGKKGQASTKEVHTAIRSSFALRISYQAVHKLLNQLSEEKIVYKESKNWRINPEWVDQTMFFLNQVNKKSKKESLEGDVQLIRFGSLQEFDAYLKDYENDFLKGIEVHKENLICWQLEHSWWPLLYMNDELKTLDRFKEKNIKYYFVLGGQTSLDKYAYNFYKKADVFMKFYPEEPTFAFKGIYNDVLFLIIYPQELVKKLNNLFQNTKDVHEVEIGEVHDLIREQHDISVLLIKNKPITQSYKKNILSIFKREIEEEENAKILQISKSLSHEVKEIRSYIPEDMLNKCNRQKPVEIKKEKRAIINLLTTGCSHARGYGSCAICGLMLYNDVTSNETFLKFVKDLENINFSKYPKLCVYTNGSFLDNCEIPIDTRKKILDEINSRKEIKEVVFESRPEFVNVDSIQQLVKNLEDTKISISLGLDIKDPVVKALLNKNIFLVEYNKAIEILKDLGIKYCTFICVKPPFLNEGEAIKIAKETIRYSIETDSPTISLEPVTLQKFTVQDHLAQNNLFRVPYLWSLIELAVYAKNYAKELNKDIEVLIGGTYFVPQPKALASNCKQCNEEITELIKEFNIKNDVSIFKDIKSLQEIKENKPLNCKCQLDWVNRCTTIARIPLQDLPKRVDNYIGRCDSYKV